MFDSNYRLLKACQGKSQSMEGLNLEEFRNQLSQYINNNHPELFYLIEIINNEKTRRKELENLCLEIIIPHIKAFRDKKFLTKDTKKIPKKETKKDHIEETKNIKKFTKKTSKKIKKISKKKLIQKDLCYSPDYLFDKNQCSKVPFIELLELAKLCEVPNLSQLYKKGNSEICDIIIQHNMKREDFLIKNNLKFPQDYNQIQKLLLEITNKFAQEKEIFEDYPKNVVLCHGHIHQTKFPDDYFLIDNNTLNRPDLVIDAEVASLGFPPNSLDQIVVKGCPFYIYTLPQFWELWIPRLKEGGRIIFYGIGLDKFLYFLPPELQAYFGPLPKGQKMNFDTVLKNMLVLAGFDPNNFNFQNVRLSTLRYPGISEEDETRSGIIITKLKK